jgi:choline dehydrogenase-like flavoprotein
MASEIGYASTSSTFVDARTLDEHKQIETDLAIIGGGPAGITLARAFAGTGMDVCLLEAGGLEAEPESQALYEGESVGIDYPLAASRLRFFGGSSNHWGGYSRPLDPIDFEPRDWVPDSGWPFGMAELEPFYSRACEILEIAPGRFDDTRYWQQETGRTLLEFATGRMRPQYVHFSPPTRFGQRYRSDLERAGNIRVLLHANVTDIATVETAKAVSHLEIRTLNGLSHRLEAKVYVLATGGLENARLLLLSNKTVAEGLGNQHDLVGRYFMEHPHLSGCGEIVVADLDRLPPIFRERVKVAGRYAGAAFNPSEDFLRQRRLLNATFMVGVAGKYHASQPPKSDPVTWGRHTDMLLAARHFLTDVEGPIDPDDSDYLGVWLGIGCACEQAPNPASRVSLSTERDALGLNRIRLDWRLTEQDRRSLVEHAHSLALELGAQGIGRMGMKLADDGRWPESVAGGSHHMGTTRMHEDPRQGVVDRNCRVHGVDNLYVAGSSVFPTSGSANPTLTLVALTLRLADHLGSSFS